MLPREFPPRSTVYGYFRRFWQDGIWSTIQATLLMAAREQAGREAQPSAAIIDSQSVKSADKGDLRLIRRAMTRARRSRAKSGTSASIPRVS